MAVADEEEMVVVLIKLVLLVELVVPIELDELDDCDDVLDMVEEVLLGGVVPSNEHVAPRAETSLNVSANDPLTAPYFDPEADAMA